MLKVVYYYRLLIITEYCMMYLKGGCLCVVLCYVEQNAEAVKTLGKERVRKGKSSVANGH